MELRDLIVTPIVLILVYLVAYWVRPRFTDVNTKRYFIPALTVRIIGSIAVGVVYQFYYDGGDTFTYHTRGSAIIWDAFMDSPVDGIKLLFAGEERIPELYQYTRQMWFYGDFSSYLIIRLALLFDLITFKTYSATAALFAVLNFTGMWALYQVFYTRYVHLHKVLAIAVFFVPSVFFWGSGILKDTITLTALGWITYSFDKIMFKRRKVLINTVVLLISFVILYSLKKYILLCFIPALIIWLYVTNIAAIRSLRLKVMIAPLIFVICGGFAYWAIIKVGEGDPKYAIENIPNTAKVTAYDIRYGWGARDGIGSGYDLGELDGTFSSMIRLMPEAVNVSLFRPYLWEVQNPLMLLSSLESLLVLVLTIVVLIKTKLIGIFKPDTKSVVLFSITFSLVFAFAVGISTYNFGTLMRYKIPLMPFFLSALLIILHENKKPKSL